jgi:serine/threonine protein kinase
MKCEHMILKQTRAVKIIRSDDDEYIAIAKKEYELLKSLDNPGVVKVFDCIHDESKSKLYMVMEFIKGETLEDYIL